MPNDRFTSSIPMGEDEYNEFYSFWEGIVFPNGEFSEAQATLELYDYQRLLREAITVYDYVTGGVVTNPSALAESVIKLADRHTETMIKDAIQEVIRRIQDGEDVESIARDLL